MLRAAKIIANPGAIGAAGGPGFTAVFAIAG